MPSDHLPLRCEKSGETTYSGQGAITLSTQDLSTKLLQVNCLQNDACGRAGEIVHLVKSMTQAQ